MALLDVIDNIKEHFSHTHKHAQKTEGWNLNNLVDSGSWVSETIKED